MKLSLDRDADHNRFASFCSVYLEASLSINIIALTQFTR